MTKMTIELDEYELINILHAVCQQSCGYNHHQIEKQLPEFHCCDYNESVYVLAKQIKPMDFDDTDYIGYVEEVKNRVLEELEELE